MLVSGLSQTISGAVSGRDHIWACFGADQTVSGTVFGAVLGCFGALPVSGSAKPFLGCLGPDLFGLVYSWAARDLAASGQGLGNKTKLFI